MCAFHHQRSRRQSRHMASPSLLPHHSFPSIPNDSMRNNSQLHASDSASTSDSDSLFCCMVCYENYQITGTHEPRVMSCGHTLCYHCLQMLYSSDLMQCCPFCKSDLHLSHPSHFPKNFSLIQFLEERGHGGNDSPPSRVNRFHRVKLAEMQCEYERAMLEQSRSELIEYDRLRDLAHSQIREIEELSQEAYHRFREIHCRLDRNISIMAMLHSSYSPSSRQHHPPRSQPPPGCHDAHRCPQRLVIHCAPTQHHPTPMTHNYRQQRHPPPPHRAHFEAGYPERHSHPSPYASPLPPHWE
jgi:hypothetical protein